MQRTHPILILAAVLALPGGVSGQFMVSGDPPEERLIAEAVRVEDAPVLDGRLTEDLWRDAPPLSGLRKVSAGAQSAVSGETEIRFTYTSQALYVGARMRSPPPERTVEMTPDAAPDEPEHLILSLDTYLPGGTSNTFMITADGRISDPTPVAQGNRVDGGLNGGWEAAAVLEDGGWTAEVRIPFSGLRFMAIPDQVWGLTVERVSPGTGAGSSGESTGRQGSSRAWWKGELLGIAGIRPRRPVELQLQIASAPSGRTMAKGGWPAFQPEAYLSGSATLREAGG